MTEHPILFSAPMVRAILDGRKTQTRRVIRGLPSHWIPTIRPVQWPLDEWGFHDMADPTGTVGTAWRCPYGKPGDRLWVRETLYLAYGSVWRYRAGGRDVADILHDGYHDERYGAFDEAQRDKARSVVPAIHMPRWACRIVLEVAEVRAQRVQEISPEDVLAEGAPGLWPLTFEQPTDGTICGPQGSPERQRAFAAANNLIMFRNLWDSINGKRPGCAWDNNPWVWATSFRRLANER